MRILFFTDSHGRGLTPISRKDVFIDSLFEKFQEIGRIVTEKAVDIVLFGGDLFDAPNVALNLCDRIIDEMESWGVGVHAVRGNHDEIGHNPNMSGQSVLDHIFRRSTIIQHLSNLPLGAEKLFIKGFDYYHDIEIDLKKDGLMSGHTGTDTKKIAVIHAFITEKPFLPMVQHIVADDIKSDFNLVLCGHYHTDFGIKKVGNTTYVNPGALARISINDMDRIPKIVILDTQSQTLDLIPLESARPGSEVFDVQKVEEMKSLQGRIDNFIESLDGAKFQGMNLKGIIQTLAESEKVEKEVVDLVLQKVGMYETV